MVVAWWPDWPVVAAGCAPERPVAVVSANRVAALTPAARSEGVTVGLRRREAQARCPDLELVAADPGRDARAWEPVVAAVEELTPSVEVLGPGALCFGARAASRYHGGDAALALRVLAVAGGAVAGGGQPQAWAGRGAGGPGPGVAVGVADGRFAASLAARAAAAGGQGWLVVPAGGSARWLAPHPVRALGPDYVDLADLLYRLGIRHLGALAALPASTVLGRFGPEGRRAHRLARGLDDREVRGRPAPPEMACEARWDPPEARAEAAAFVAKALADDLKLRLGEGGLSAPVVAIEAETEHGEHLVRRWRHDAGLPAPALAERARWQIEAWLAGGSGRPPTGGLTLLRLTPLELQPGGGVQLGLWGGTDDDGIRVGRAVARVQSLLGPEGALRAVLGGGRGYAERVRLVAWGEDPPPAPAGSPRPPAPPWPGRLPSPAPALVYRSPHPADVCDRSGRPVEVSGRGELSAAPVAVALGGGPLEEIVGWAGPWPAGERWWDGGRRRVWFQVVVVSGRAYLVSREGGRWWVEASY
jgi:protein ImuB